MILDLHDRLRERIHTVLSNLYGLGPDTSPPIVIQYPPNRLLGDLAVTVAFELVRTLRKAPRVIAQEIVDALGSIDGVATTEVASNGYVNLHLARADFLRAALSPSTELSGESDTGKIIVEHTAINPNKAAHIGHLRNASLGDTLVRLLRFRRQSVEVQNYIDDTGVQVADVVVGFRQLESRSPEDIRRLADDTRFDYYCWDLYAQVTRWYEADPARLQHRKTTLHDLEQGDNPSSAIARFIAGRIVRSHLATMDRLNVDYDLLSWEGDILRLDFWTTAFEILKQAGAVFLKDDGPQAGCWVMEIDDGQSETDANGGQDDVRLKVIVRSDGTVTYVGKDIAYQLWKFGLLGKDFGFQPFATQRSGRALWSTTADADGQDRSDAPSFGLAAAVYNVIDTRQSYLQQLLKQALTELGHSGEADRSVHFSYEMVALSHTTAEALGYNTGEAGDRPFIEVSGRKGLGVKADDLLDRLTDAATKEVAARNPEFDTAETNRIATMIAAAAVRYFMIKYSRGKVIAFDMDEALSFEGESGPYLQYAAVRAANILHKLDTKIGIDELGIVDALPSLAPEPLNDPDGTDLWALVLEASRLDEVAEQAIRTLELSALAKYSFGLAQTFNAFYHRYPVVNEIDPEVRAWRAAGVAYFRTQLTHALSLMGCDVPPRM